MYQMQRRVTLLSSEVSERVEWKIVGNVGLIESVVGVCIGIPSDTTCNATRLVLLS